MKNLFGICILSVFCSLPMTLAEDVVTETPVAEDAVSDENAVMDREPASQRAPAQDRQEGWVVRQTESGLVKVPAKQFFRFEGASLSGKAYTPFQAVFDQRPGRKSKSLIPVRTSFKREVLDASGYSGR